MDIVLFPFVFSALTVWLVEHCFKAHHSHIVRSGAYPNTVNARNATHYFELRIAGLPLSELLIEVPHYFKIDNEITVITTLFKTVDATVSITSGSVKVCFSQAIPPNTTLVIFLNGVQNSIRTGSNWLYTVHGTNHSVASLRLLGKVHIEIYE